MRPDTRYLKPMERLCGKINLLSVKVDVLAGDRQGYAHDIVPVNDSHLSRHHTDPINAIGLIIRCAQSLTLRLLNESMNSH